MAPMSNRVNFDIFQHFSKFAPLSSQILRKILNLILPLMYMLLKFDYTKLSVSNFFQKLSKVIKSFSKGIKAMMYKSTDQMMYKSTDHFSDVKILFHNSKTLKR